MTHDKLISIQPPGCTRSSSIVTITRPPTSSSSLKITDRSLYASLPASFRQPCRNHSPSYSSHFIYLGSRAPSPGNMYYSRIAILPCVRINGDDDHHHTRLLLS